MLVRLLLSSKAVCSRFHIFTGPTLIPTANPTAIAPGIAQSSLANLQMTPVPQPMPAAPFPHGLAPIAPRPAMFPQIIYWYPTPPVSPQTIYTTNGGPSMVIMRGLPFNVSLQDILNFFQGFPEVCHNFGCFQFNHVITISFDIKKRNNSFFFFFLYIFEVLNLLCFFIFSVYY